jgi:hypothetical protein
MTHPSALQAGERARDFQGLEEGFPGQRLGQIGTARHGGTNFDPAKHTHVHSGVVEWKGETLHSA